MAEVEELQVKIQKWKKEYGDKGQTEVMNVRQDFDHQRTQECGLWSLQEWHWFK